MAGAHHGKGEIPISPGELEARCFLVRHGGLGKRTGHEANRTGLLRLFRLYRQSFGDEFVDVPLVHAPTSRSTPKGNHRPDLST